MQDIKLTKCAGYISKSSIFSVPSLGFISYFISARVSSEGSDS